MDFEKDKYAKRCKHRTWKRQQGEYLTAVCWKHNLQHNSKAVNMNKGEVVIIKCKNIKRGKQNIDVIRKLFQGKGDQIRGAGVKTPRN